MITGLHHINLVVPAGTLPAARAFYGATLGLTPVPAPEAQRTSLAWFDIGDSGQQVHVAFGRDADFSTEAAGSQRHPCFRVGGGVSELRRLQQRICEHFIAGGEGAPRECDEAVRVDGRDEDGVQGPTRFFARDYAGNRLEFSLVVE